MARPFAAAGVRGDRGTGRTARRCRGGEAPRSEISSPAFDQGLQVIDCRPFTCALSANTPKPCAPCGRRRSHPPGYCQTLPYGARQCREALQWRCISPLLLQPCCVMPCPLPGCVAPLSRMGRRRIVKTTRGNARRRWRRASGVPASVSACVEASWTVAQSSDLVCPTHRIGYNHCKCPAMLAGREAIQETSREY